MFVFLWTLIWSFQCTLLRDNIKIEGLRSEDSLEGQDLFRMISYETSNAGCSSLGIKSIYPKHLCKKRCLNADISLPLSSVNWVLLFEMMLQIAVSHTEECMIVEAISIMNVILMSSNAQTETEKWVLCKPLVANPVKKKYVCVCILNVVLLEKVWSITSFWKRSTIAKKGSWLTCAKGSSLSSILVVKL